MLSCFPSISNFFASSKSSNFIVTVYNLPLVYCEVTIKLLDLEDAKKLLIDGKQLNTTQVLQLAMSGDIELHCTCPDFKYRFSYLAFNNKYGFFKETRFPKKRNPELKGCACKHCYSALKVLPMHFKSIQSDLMKRKILMNPKVKIKPLK